MRVEAALFNLPAVFFVLVAGIYGWLTGWAEWVGLICILLTGGLFFMVGIYLRMLAKRHGDRPEDRLDGEITENSGEQGMFAPWSWWPLWVGIACALGFTAMAVGWWIMVPAAMMSIVAVVGWVMEYSVGRHAH